MPAKPPKRQGRLQPLPGLYTAVRHLLQQHGRQDFREFLCAFFIRLHNCNDGRIVNERSADQAALDALAQLVVGSETCGALALDRSIADKPIVLLGTNHDAHSDESISISDQWTILRHSHPLECVRLRACITAISPSREAAGKKAVQLPCSVNTWTYDYNRNRDMLEYSGPRDIECPLLRKDFLIDDFKFSYDVKKDRALVKLSPRRSLHPTDLINREVNVRVQLRPDPRTGLMMVWESGETERVSRDDPAAAEHLKKMPKLSKSIETERSPMMFLYCDPVRRCTAWLFDWIVVLVRARQADGAELFPWSVELRRRFFTSALTWVAYQHLKQRMKSMDAPEWVETSTSFRELRKLIDSIVDSFFADFKEASGVLSQRAADEAVVAPWLIERKKQLCAWTQPQRRSARNAKRVPFYRTAALWLRRRKSRASQRNRRQKIADEMDRNRPADDPMPAWARRNDTVLRQVGYLQSQLLAVASLELALRSQALPDLAAITPSLWADVPLRAKSSVQYPGDHLELGTHAEVRVLSHFLGRENCDIPYIGVSKLCCAHCRLIFSDLPSAGGHGLAFPWPLPSQLADDSAAANDFLKRLLGDLLEMFRRLPPVTLQDALSESDFAWPERDPHTELRATPLAKYLIEVAAELLSTPDHLSAFDLNGLRPLTKQDDVHVSMEVPHFQFRP